MNKRRVVITGLGVISSSGTNVSEFNSNIQKGVSGICYIEELKRLNFSCQIAGLPIYKKEYLNDYFNSIQLKGLSASGMEYGVMAGMDAWQNAGFSVNKSNIPLWDTGVIFGTGILGVDKFREAIYKVDNGNVRRLGSTTVTQTMASGISAFLGGMIGCGNMVTTNSSACSTGTEAILMAYNRITNNEAEVILAGSTSDSGPYVWGGFDAMRILPYKYNDNPTEASRPMSATASGFVPGSGAGALVLESLESAKKRGATIYAEILGGHVNSGGQRGGGSMTAPNNEAVQRCIRKAIDNASIQSEDIDVINGHLTATIKDVDEIQNWCEALKRKGEDFPYINSLKSMVGHCLAASGSIESVATVLQLKENYVFGNINCEDLHPEIASLINREKIPTRTLDFSPNIIAKASFGFGDVNACVIFKKYS
ncbi:beta-ketoacyl-[acyl-carrier-protein] synthase family protein [Aquimarina muelleri]|uniref:3-oxoacyl-[acyl-carrier-protein] synthase 1 n=1 Tax=Aquimarina muelleri TaxID=279356 RepID=A0A918JU10_9FLAO|nr:beta-ketoacyl-[acyl-carrier-protein] synthase family protein [Aquimarina muelleri]MCX2763070.1 beta-ketoacyl-[acyl-carrier-protein] synthase family protein [Aquimarina muelleri]GGX03009.1 beta-ketoacyl-ACP synthase [Aquimarina muelleri]